MAVGAKITGRNDSRRNVSLAVALVFALGLGCGRVTMVSPALAQDTGRTEILALTKTTKDLQDRLLKLESRNGALIAAAPINAVSLEAFDKEKLHVAQIEKNFATVSDLTKTTATGLLSINKITNDLQLVTGSLNDSAKPQQTFTYKARLAVKQLYDFAYCENDNLEHLRVDANGNGQTGGGMLPLKNHCLTGFTDAAMTL